MIEKIVGFKVGDRFLPTIEDAQRVELTSILHGLDDGATTAIANAAADIIINNKDAVLNILTMTASSHPRARKANGATRKPRKAKLDEPDDHKVPPTAEDAPGVTVPGSGKYRGK